MNKFKSTLVAVLGLITLTLVSCKKEYDNPPTTVIGESQIVTLTDLVASYSGTPIKFQDGDTNVYCVVTADEVSGNLYKNVYVTDGNIGLNVRLVSSGGLYVGDSIRINLNGTTLSEYNGMMQLDSVDVDLNVVKQATNVTVTPVSATIDQALSDPTLVGRLIKFDDVEFLNTEVGSTFADAANQQSMNRNLMTCASASTILVRTSGFASFAGSPIPFGNGSVTAILGRYNADMQLYIRDLNDVSLGGPSCQPLIFLKKDFEDQSVTSGGWTVQNIVGAVNWTASPDFAQFGAYYGKISNYNGATNEACETWLISPSMDLTAASAPVFSFQNTCNYSGNDLEVFVSTDYDGVSAPSSATWTPLSPSLSIADGSWTWVYSGAMDMTSYISTNTHVAFKYTGTGSNGRTWEIDEILIQE